ncbi:MAG TPA: SMI1/KNR4 family protein [Dehalococcoidia bacterium]|nr:SMI1/KNR4 family protein [Dehalococcoidia bacterium]
MVGELPRDYLEMLQADYLKPHEPGLSDAEVAGIETRYGFVLPPDLRSRLQTFVPVGKNFYDWRRGIRVGIDDDVRCSVDWWLKFPLDGMAEWVAIEHGWPEAWGPKPESTKDALVIARERVSRAPRPIPIFSHRYMPDTPCEAGNPVYSTVQTDTIYYGNDLAGYLHNEFGVPRPAWAATAPKPIPF